MEEEYETGAVVGQPPVNRGQHISKRSLRNKSLSVSFNPKDLQDYVGGFHKRKKKRRKEAEKKQEEAERRRRLEDRKRRRKEKEYALYGDAPPEKDAGSDDGDSLQNDGDELNQSVSGTTTYENGDVMVTVTTSELTREEEEHPIEKLAPLPPVPTEAAAKKNNIPVIKKKPLKKTRKGSSRPKLLSKRDRRKGKKSKKGR